MRSQVAQDCDPWDKGTTQGEWLSVWEDYSEQAQGKRTQAERCSLTGWSSGLLMEVAGVEAEVEEEGIDAYLIKNGQNYSKFDENYKSKSESKSEETSSNPFLESTTMWRCQFSQLRRQVYINIESQCN